MKTCWFSGTKATLSGYRYEKGERPDGEEGGGYQNIKIYPVTAEALSFEVQFHKYNENTLIVTRNISLPQDLSTKVKRDIQLWALNSPDCATP